MKDYSLKINGNQYDISIEDVNEESTMANVTSAPKAAQAAAGGPGLQVKSPLPGTILSVNVKEGDRVAPRQTLFVLEAMKMENNIDAERGGVVKSIHVQKGATVMEGDLLIVIE